MVFKYDGYVVWSEGMKKELHEYYPHTRQSACYVTGAPQFDVFFQERFRRSRAEFCARHSLDEKRPIILYAPGTPNMFKEDRAILHLAEQVVSGAFGDAQMLIRPHPLHDDGRLNESLRGFGSRVVTQRSGQAGLKVAERALDESQIIEWVNTFRHADVVVNLSSTAAIDAAIFDRPVVNLNFDPEPDRRRQRLIKEINHVWPHSKAIAESGGLWLVNDLEEMITAVKTYLERPELHHKERRRMAEMVCGQIDGRCGERMAQALLDFAHKRSARQVSI
jgi:CDP-glycerol glycerophosphotransferase (TagB/SpsB family)